MPEFNHQHLIVDFAYLKGMGLYDDLSPTKKEEFIMQMLDDLVELIGMKIFMPSRARYCDSEGNEGTTGDVVIETSHASVHIWDYQLIGRLDVYSCKTFDVKQVIDFLGDHFALSELRTHQLDRN